MIFRIVEPTEKVTIEKDKDSMKDHIIFIKDDKKYFSSDDYNYVFNLTNGEFARWGKNEEDDPQWSQFGPEILDIEISTSCSAGCKICYKSNESKGSEMSLETFKNIINKMGPQLTQTALGIGSIDSNKDLYRIMEYCRSIQIVPNITINGLGLDEYHTKELVRSTGAIAVSKLFHKNKSVCYDAVDSLTKNGHKQVNIHHVLCEESYDKCFESIDDLKTDRRLNKLNAIVFLMLKPKGKRNTLTRISERDKLKKLIEYALSKDASIGFDSCCANFVMSIFEELGRKDMLKYIEPCEGCAFSSYCNVNGEFFGCSFTENESTYKGVNIVSAKDFLKDVWFSEEAKLFRKKLLYNNRYCPIFDLSLR